jgi:hypothetical protein
MRIKEARKSLPSGILDASSSYNLRPYHEIEEN